MRTQHPEIWNDITGEWLIVPEGAAAELRISFSENLRVTDSAFFLCGNDATPNYWTGETPEGTVLALEQKHRRGSGKGSVAVQKMAFKRGQFMVVCNGARMNYEDHIIFYGLGAREASWTGKQPGKEFKYAVIEDENGPLRRFAYRRP